MSKLYETIARRIQRNPEWTVRSLHGLYYDALSEREDGVSRAIDSGTDDDVKDEIVSFLKREGYDMTIFVNGAAFDPIAEVRKMQWIPD